MTEKVPSIIQQNINNKIIQLYGKEIGTKKYVELIEILDKFYLENTGFQDREEKDVFSEKDVVLITYGDQVRSESRKHLEVLLNFLKDYFSDSFSAVHILPFFPYSSDDGFSIIDYKLVNPELGAWEDIIDIGKEFELMFDAVINHISAKSSWFKGYIAEDREYNDFFISVDPDTDLSAVTRPRDKPLLTPFQTKQGTKYIWTTFSPDQVDLNYKNPDLLLEIIKLLLFYIKKGAKIIRLDAIAYLWKEPGTNCIHLPQTHLIIQLFRDILKTVAPHVLIITETNVPHKENIKYFGDGYNEAQLVYQFALPPLVLHTFTTGDATSLSNWTAKLEYRSSETTYFNFLASHDGIGVRPVEGILSEDEIELLVKRTKDHGGLVSYKINSDGSKSPYELNISYFDAIINDDESKDIKISKFLASQAILLSLAGIPGIYIHSVLGSGNYLDGVKKTGINRSINREKLNLLELREELENKNSIRHGVYSGYTKLIKIRREEKAFHPNSSQQVLFLDSRIFALLRVSEISGESIIALHNVSADKIKLDLDLNQIGIEGYNMICELILGSGIKPVGSTLNIELNPYQIQWIKIK